MNVEIGERYRIIKTGEEYIVIDKTMFNTCIVLERGGETFYCRNNDFILNFEKVS